MSLVMAEELKTCCTCHQSLPLSEFNKRAAAKDGLQARCRSCSRQWYLRNRIAHMAQVRKRNAAHGASCHRRRTAGQFSTWRHRLNEEQTAELHDIVLRRLSVVLPTVRRDDDVRVDDGADAGRA